MFGPILYLGLRQWSSSKQVIEDFIPLDHNFLHLAVGVLIYLGISSTSGSFSRRWFGWLTVLIVALVNEASDIISERWHDTDLQYKESMFDLGWTLALPSLLLASSMLHSRFRHFNLSR